MSLAFLIILVFILAFIFLYFLQRYPLFGIILSLIFAIGGELLRIPLGPENGFLPNDIFLPILIAVWLIKKAFLKESLPKVRLMIPFLLFIGFASLSLLNSLRYLESFSQFLASSLYLLRFISYFFLYILTVDLIDTKKKSNLLLKAIAISTLLIAIAGFVQLFLYPDFSEMADKYGWDPHEDRLLSTWFDPNFVGGFFSFMSIIFIGIILYTKSLKNKMNLGFLVLILLSGLFYTYSRSAYLAFAVSLFFIGFIKSRQLLIIITTIAILLIPFSERAQERLLGMANSAKSMLGIGTEVADPTAELRFQSWQNSISIVKEHPFLGVGYNTLRYIQQDKGIIEDSRVHHASGSDSSLLTILMTTGIFGFISYLWLYGAILRQSFRIWRKTAVMKKYRGLSLGLFCGLLGLFVHSLFVNSLLFTPLLTFIWILVGTVEKSVFPGLSTQRAGNRSIIQSF